MKISNSKKQLAKIIHENGGWRDGAESAAQCIGGEISFWHDTATRQPIEGWCGNYLGRKHDIEFTGVKLHNWHQTILPRKEYFHLYPAPDADGWIEWKGGECPVGEDDLIDVKFSDGDSFFGVDNAWDWSYDHDICNIIAYRLHKPEQAKPDYCESVTRSIPEPSDKPTIEQLAADYRNRKDYAERKQEEADAAKADADEALRKLELAGEEIGLIVTPIAVKKESELVIAVQVGDKVECIRSNVNPNKYIGSIGTVLEVDDSSTPYLVDFGGMKRIWCHEVKFICRP